MTRGLFIARDLWQKAPSQWLWPMAYSFCGIHLQAMAWCLRPIAHGLQLLAYSIWPMSATQAVLHVLPAFAPYS